MRISLPLNGKHVLRSVDLWVRKCVKSRAFLLRIFPLPPALTQFRITQNYTHLSIFVFGAQNGVASIVHHYMQWLNIEEPSSFLPSFQ